MYTTGAYSIVYALDPRTARCCGNTTRSAARGFRQGLLRRRQPRCRLHDGKVYVGTFDGRLVALNAKDGSKFGRSTRSTIPRGTTTRSLAHRWW